MTLYFISGLGADKRIFEKLQFSNSFKLVFIDWIVPVKNEPLRDYATRLSHTINTSEPFVIIGLSFGGMIATELSPIVSPQKKQFYFRAFLRIASDRGIFKFSNSFLFIN
jgi:hypothetical protein